jgi:FkbM family methyltransferase
VILLTSLYHDADARRRDELLECLRRNVAAERLDEIHVFIEDAMAAKELQAHTEFSVAKVRLIEHGRRVTYRSLFDYANQHLQGRGVVIANADIFFDDTLARLDGYDLSGKLLCLSRWDVHADGSASLFEHPSSQDAWIFKAPVPSFHCDFHLGLLGCDNRLAWEAEQAGLKLSNPSRSVRAHHLHLSQVHHYSERQRLAGPTRSISATPLETPYPSSLGTPPAVPCAAVAFSEAMGYTVASLETGASSHNNDARPFTKISEPLLGRMFTQVVSAAVTPIEVEFITSGKLYVLVGTDWDGHDSSAAWLNRHGFRENLPSLETERQTGFEVWSLVAEAGDRFVLPTQVMLVADYLVKRANGLPAANGRSKRSRTMAKESIFALTSLSPQQQDPDLTRKCIQSWQRAGLQVRAFNHPSEISKLEKHFEVEFIRVEETSAHTFEKHFIPINVMLKWAAAQDVPALVINSDIELQMEPWEIKRARWLSEQGLCYFVRYNHEGNYARAFREPDGIDAFLLHGRDASFFPDSFLSMGQPYWDYWLPHTFASLGRPIYTVEFPAAFHLKHQNRWSWNDWHRCALEFERIIGDQSSDRSFGHCVSRAHLRRQAFDRSKISVPQRPPTIREWVEAKFRYPGAKTFLELGAHRGRDTEWMANIPGVSLYALEPDPRNQQPARNNVTLWNAAIADFDGRGPLTLSEQGWGQEWTFSSSIKPPLNHLHRFPVTFGEAVEVEMMRLDSFCKKHELGVIDFILADIQGAEGEMIRGGRETLARTRYLFTEYSDDELYENQVTLSEILAMLPDFRVIELWPDDVLLENTRFQV